MIQIRRGQCKRCGRCCDLFCPYMYWVANVDIAAGDVMTYTGTNFKIMSGCTLNGTPLKSDPSIYGGGCGTFPSSPTHTQQLCGFYWEEVTEYGDNPNDVYYPPKPEV